MFGLFTSSRSVVHESKMPYMLYHYTPSVLAAAMALALFFLSTAFHIFQMIKNKTWYLIPFVIGGFCKSPSANRPDIAEHVSFL